MQHPLVDVSKKLHPLLLRWWAPLKRRLNDFLSFGLVLLTAGILLLLLAPHWKADWLHDPAGALVVAGLSLVISTASGKEAVRLQNAKDANTNRKNQLYGPLHTELTKLRECLEEANAGQAPYPSWIEGAGQEPARSIYFHPYLAPAFRLWPEFKEDYRIDNFSTIARNLLDDVQRLAAAYNAAIATTLKPACNVLTPHVVSAFDQLSKSAAFQEWCQRSKAGTVVIGAGHEWNTRLANCAPQDEAAMWLGDFGANRWLLAGSPDQAAAYVYDGYQRISVTPPSLSFFEDIFQRAWPELQELPSYQDIRTAELALLKRVCSALDHLEHGLRSIRDQFEGGAPPV